MKFPISLLLSFFLFLLLSCSNKTKIACVGDSITEGSGIAVPGKSSYPVVLGGILGAEYSVLNFGKSATTMLKKGNFPYWDRKEFANVFAFEPDIIVIKLGTNDTKPENWNAGLFEQDYQAMIDTFKTMQTNPEIYLCLPVPVFETRWGINDSTLINGVIPVVERMAEINHLQIINLYEGLKDQAKNFPDGVHPNEAGAKLMAEIVAQKIKK